MGNSALWQHVGRTQPAAAAPPTTPVVCPSCAMLEVAEGSPAWACGIGTAIVADVMPLILPRVVLCIRGLSVAYGEEGIAVDTRTREGGLAIGA